jgi:lariat debranching enzyme
MNVAVAGCIHG